MKNFKHTPGTWAAKDCNMLTKKRTEIWSSEDNEEPIFEIIHNEVNLSEPTPNAKLIAAAPELLQALINVLDDNDLFGKIQPTTTKHVLEVLKKATK